MVEKMVGKMVLEFLKTFEIPIWFFENQPIKDALIVLGEDPTVQFLRLLVRINSYLQISFVLSESCFLIEHSKTYIWVAYKFLGVKTKKIQKKIFSD